MRKRNEKTKKMRRNGVPQTTLSVPKPPCFVCDEEVSGKGIPLLVGHTPYSKTGLPTKIGQLMGEGFMVVVSVEDTLCKRCSALLNHLDKLESDLYVVKKALTDYLKVKYQLTDEDLDLNPPMGFEEASSVAVELQEGGKPNKTENSKKAGPETKPKVHGRSFQYEYNDDKVESEGSGSEHGATKRVNVEIILEDSGSQRKYKKQRLEKQEKTFKCPTCSFETSDKDTYDQHPEGCKNFPHKCTICGKVFENNKNIQNHIMQAHLSKWTCHFCSITFSEEVEFTSHMKSHLGSNYYAQQVKLEVHSDSENSNHYEPPKNLLGNYECNICEFQSDDKVLFDDHLRKHVVLKLFRCDACGMRFEDKVSLERHVRCRHDTRSTAASATPAIFRCGVAVPRPFDKKGGVAAPAKSPNADVDEKPVVEARSVTLSEWAAARQQDFLAQSDLSADTVELKKAEKMVDKCEASFHFHTCNTCSLTFVNDALYKQHMKNHSDKDVSDHENSLMSGLVETNDYVESVMDDSLEDIFVKMHSQTESRLETHVKDENLDVRSCFKCSQCLEEFDKLESLESHKEKHASDGNKNVSVKDGGMEENSYGNVINQKCVSPSNTAVETGHSMNGKEKIDCGAGKLKPGMCMSDDDYDDNSSLDNIYKMVCERKTEPAKEKENDGEEMNTKKVELMAKAKDADMAADQEEKADTKKTYVCAMCGYRTAELSTLQQHFMDHDDEGIHACKLCNRYFPSDAKLKKHIKAQHNTAIKMTCPNCFKDFPNKMFLQRHLQEDHQREKIIYRCQFCNEQFTSRKAYKVHEEAHPERFEHKCNECNLTFVKEKQLADHREVAHRDPHCRFCGKEITKLKTLRNHESRHLKERDNFECDSCKKVFKTKTGLRHHVAVHTGEYKYCCDYCGRGFMSRMMMEEHRSMHTKEERYVCDVCGRKFSFQSTYWIHRKWHDNPYPYKCSFCGRMFRHSSLLAVHKRKHTGERPYKCPHCPLTFPVGGTLKRHLILHTGVYPFNCDGCKRGFTTRHKYATHMAKVHGNFELLNARPQQNEFKMVIRENEPQKKEEAAVWQLADDSEHGEINFKLASASASADSLDNLESAIPCSIVSEEDLLADNVIPTRVVEIVLDEASQAVATVTLADPTASLLPELWYQ